MTTQANIPTKWYVPFANGDASRVELPVTTADPTRMSQTLGSPPLTMQPPESGGVPPQGEDFNGGMNQIARVAWWVLNGGGWPFDASFATNANINGYPNGATLQSADFRGDWINTADGNVNNPDTTGTGWVPGYQYGVTALTGQTGGTVTLTPAQASKETITIAGVLGSALTINLPAWLKNWRITNNTTGAFVTIVKTTAGSGVTIPQNGAATLVSGDGTNITQVSGNIAQGTTPTQTARIDQVAGVIGAGVNVKSDLAVAGTSLTFTADQLTAATALNGTLYQFANVNVTVNGAVTGINGLDTGVLAINTPYAVYLAYNPGTQTLGAFLTLATTLQGIVYGGANRPAGYTVTALIGIWSTNSGAATFKTGHIRGRRYIFGPVNILSSNATPGSPTSFALGAANVPLNSISVRLLVSVNNSVANSSQSLNVFADTLGSGQASATGQVTLGSAITTNGDVDMVTPGSLFWTATNGAGNALNNVSVVSLTF